MYILSEQHFLTANFCCIYKRAGRMTGPVMGGYLSISDFNVLNLTFNFDINGKRFHDTVDHRYAWYKNNDLAILCLFLRIGSD